MFSLNLDIHCPFQHLRLHVSSTSRSGSFSFRSSSITPHSQPLNLLLKRWPPSCQSPPLPPRLDSSQILSTQRPGFVAVRSICLRYKHSDLLNREYVYNKHDEDSTWQERFALWLIWAAKLRVTVVNLCPPANRDHSSAFCHNHWSHLVTFSGHWETLEADSLFGLWRD